MCSSSYWIGSPAWGSSPISLLHHAKRQPHVTPIWSTSTASTSASSAHIDPTFPRRLEGASPDASLPPEAGMDCPTDRVPLQIVHFHSIPIQRCPKCEGTWYEKDQLRILKDKEAHGDYCWINLDLWRDVAKFRAASSSRYA